MHKLGSISRMSDGGCPGFGDSKRPPPLDIHGVRGPAARSRAGGNRKLWLRERGPAPNRPSGGPRPGSHLTRARVNRRVHPTTGSRRRRAVADGLGCRAGFPGCSQNRRRIRGNKSLVWVNDLLRLNMLPLWRFAGTRIKPDASVRKLSSKVLLDCMSSHHPAAFHIRPVQV